MLIKELYNVLHTTPLFQHLTLEEMEPLLQPTHYALHHYAKDALIHHDGDACAGLEIVIKGSIHAQKINKDGGVLTINYLNVGGLIGTNVIFSKDPVYPMNVFAKTPTTIMHIKKDLLLKLCGEDQKFLLAFLQCVSDKTYFLTNKIKTLSHHSIRSSLMNFLKEQYRIQKKPQITLPMTKKDLAEFLGIQRTSLSRELSKMKKEGLLDFNATTITLSDLSLLNEDWV